MDSQTNILAFIKNYWFLGLLAFSVVVTYANNQTKHDELERRLVAYELKVDRNDATFLQIQKDIVEIKTTLEYIKLKVQ